MLKLLLLTILILGFLTKIHCVKDGKPSALEKPDPVPNFRNITLNETNSNTALWYADIAVNDAYTVCAESGILQIYIPFVWDSSDFYLRQFQLFDGDSLQNLVNGSDDTWLNIQQHAFYFLRYRNSTSGCYTVYLPRNEWTVENQFSMFFKILDVKNCPTQNQVFQLFDDGGNFGALSSTPSGKCEYFIYSGPEWYNVPSVWIENVTVNSNENYIFKSALNNNFLFSLNASDASKWQSFGMYTQILSITVPASAEIEIEFSPIKKDVNIYNADTTIQKGIMASSGYCGDLPYDLGIPYHSSIPSMSITFVLKQFNEKIPIFINTDNGTFVLDETTTIQTNYFSIRYEETIPKSTGFLIEYTIEKQKGCRDTDSGCENNLDKCGNSLYKPFMCRHCKFTCNLCYDPQCS